MKVARIRLTEELLREALRLPADVSIRKVVTISVGVFEVKLESESFPDKPSGAPVPTLAPVVDRQELPCGCVVENWSWER